MPTIKDVAREAGVSIATVSYVLNNKKTMVSEETRQQVLDTIERIGYTPNVTARNLKASQTRLIGYAWHEVQGDQENSVLDRFTYYLAQAAEATGYHLLTFTYPQNDPIPVYDDLIRTQRVDAFVLAGTVRDDPRIRFLMESGFPFVSFGRSNPEWDFPWVDTDGTEGVRDAVDYLVAAGHRRIAMVAWPEESISGSFRVQGYLDGLNASGIPFNPDYLIRGEHTVSAGRSAFVQWMRMPLSERPTAIIAITDLIAIGILNQAEAFGLNVGQELSVIGFDDAPLSQYLRPALSTIQQPIIEIGRELMYMLNNGLNKNKWNDCQVLLPPRLIIRASCGAPPI